MLKNCKICNTQFKVKPYFHKHGWGQYCSQICKHLGFRTGKEVSCFICKSKIYKSPRQLKHSKSGKFFCNKSCQTKWRNQFFSGTLHSQWKGGLTTYRNVILKNKVLQMCRQCKITDKRILIVHHIDENRKNNKSDNLAWLCHNCHRLVHHDKVEKQKFLRGLKIL